MRNAIFCGGGKSASASSAHVEAAVRPSALVVVVISVVVEFSAVAYVIDVLSVEGVRWFSHSKDGEEEE